MANGNDDDVYELGYGVMAEGYLTPPADGRDEYWSVRNTLYAKALLNAMAGLQYTLYPSLSDEQRQIAEAIERYIRKSAAGYMRNWGYSPDGHADTETES